MVRGTRNKYFAQRHGKSHANEEGIIVSSAAQGVPGFGLTDEGREQARRAALAAKEGGILDESVLIVSSDFLRARETAEITAAALGARDAVVLSDRLRERFFGELDGQSNEHYEKVWAFDLEDHLHERFGSESVASVLARTLSLIQELESRHEGRDILLVSHGDTLQILQTHFEAVRPSLHRSLPHLGTGEIRPL